MSDEKSLEELVSELAGRLSKSEKIKEECSLKFNAVKKALINCYGNSDDFVKVAYIDKACMDVRDLATFLAVLKLSVHNENNVNNTRLDNDGLSVFLINSICGSDISPVTREDLMDTAETLFIDGYIDTYRSNQAIAAMNKFTAKPNLFLVQYKFSMTMAAKDSEKMDTSDVLINFARLLVYICCVSEEQNPNPSKNFLQGIYNYLKTQLDFISSYINDSSKRKILHDECYSYINSVMTRANSKIAVNNTSKNNKQSNRGCLKAIIILIIVMVSTFAVGLIYNYAIFLLSNGFR